MPGALRMRSVFILALSSFLIFTCKPAEPTTDTSATTGTTATTTTTAPSGGGFQAVMWTPPNLDIPNFNFPEPEATIVGWTDTNDQAAITLHMWGIWTGLTQQTSETYDGQKLLVFETWRDPDDLIAEGAAGTPAAAATAQRAPRRLKRPHQFFKHPHRRAEGGDRLREAHAAVRREDDRFRGGEAHGRRPVPGGLDGAEGRQRTAVREGDGEAGADHGRRCPARGSGGARRNTHCSVRA